LFRHQEAKIQNNHFLITKYKTFYVSHQKNPVEELQSVERRDAHVEEDPVEDGHRDVAKERRHQRRHPDRHENQHVRHALLSIE
jgi:hypothetical protein